MNRILWSAFLCLFAAAARSQTFAIDEPPSSPMTIEHDVTVEAMVSDRFTWIDSSGQPRVAVLAHNDGQVGPGGVRGGALRELRYQLPNGSTRIASVTTDGNGAHAGFGYATHQRRSGCSGTYERIFEGRHHAIFRFNQSSDCGTAESTTPVAIEWMFTTGHDHPLWAITHDADWRGPLGELNIDGVGLTNLDGTASGNEVPYVKKWLDGPLTGDSRRNATMGIVQTQTLTQFRQISDATNRSDSVITASVDLRKSSSAYIVLGMHTTSPVETQVTQVETAQSLVLSASTGSVVTTGPAGITRADSVTYAPAGYNHVYGALAFSAQGNELDANIAVGGGVLRKPLLIVSNYAGTDPTVKLDDVTLVADFDYFASRRPRANELWITLNFDLTGAANRVEVHGTPGEVPLPPTGVTATALSSTQVNVTWIASIGADSYEIHRKEPGNVFELIGTSAGTSFPDTTADPETSYLYRLRAVNDGGTSPNSAVDLATTVIFTDSPLTAGALAQAIHLEELRTAVTAVRALADLGPAGVTDETPAGIPIKAIHLEELRTALDEARLPLGFSTGGYTDAALAGVVVKAVHMQELRDRVQ